MDRRLNSNLPNIFMYRNKIHPPTDFPVFASPVPLWKRFLDVGIILASAPVLLPVMAAMGLLVRIVSQGPVLFRQERVGYLGQRFMCFKFRTMHVNADRIAKVRRATAPVR